MEYISAVAIALGIAIGVARRGSLTRLLELRLRHPWLVALAFGLQAAMFILPLEASLGDAVAPILTATNLFILAFVALNLRIAGLKLLGLGLALNTLVMLANGGYMPVSEQSLRSTGHGDQIDVMARVGHLDKSRLLGPDTRLAFLSDVLPVPQLQRVFSLGDLLVGLGAVWLIAAGMGGRDGARSAALSAAASKGGGRT